MIKLLKMAFEGLKKGVSAMLPTAMLAMGAVAVSCGVAMIYLPAGVIMAGALAIIGGVLLIRGGGDEV